MKRESILQLEIECGSGTYIRAIGRDIAKELNSLATMSSLIRTKVDSFNLEKCHEIQDIENIDEKIIPIKEILSYPTLNLTKTEKDKILNGQKLSLANADGVYMLDGEDDVLALVQIKGNIAKMSLFLG